MVQWPGTQVWGRLIKRYKRFLADMRLDDGSIVTAHCANTGSMKTCLEEGARCILTHHDNPNRKLAYSWQAIDMPDGWVCINTALPNQLVERAILDGVVTELRGYDEVKREARIHAKTRIDFRLRDGDRPDCYVEVKNVTLLLDDGVVGFPDAVTTRGQKHLDELVDLAAQGQRAVLLFCVNRASATLVRPADAFDPDYAHKLRQAARQGVEVLAYRTAISDVGIRLDVGLPVELGTA